MAREVPASRVAAYRGRRPVTGPPTGNTDRSAKDDGLRRVLTWTLIALVVSLVMAAVGATLAVRWFDRP